MAESLTERLKRIAAEKKGTQKKAAVAPVVVEEVKATETVVVSDQPVVEVNEEKSYGSGNSGTDTATTVGQEGQSSTGHAGAETTGSEVCNVVDDSSVNRVDSVSDNSSNDVLDSNTVVIQPTPADHPLAMMFAEMEAALLTADPTFKTVLRDVHRHLGKDPDLVTLMTEEEVALVVKGLVVFANSEIVEPAKAKAIKATSKKAISADDL